MTWQIKLEMLVTHAELWNLVDGTHVAPADAPDIEGTEAGKLSLQPLKTSKEVWDGLKQLYEKSNKASHEVHLHKKVWHDDIINC